MKADAENITELLAAWSGGDPQALDVLTPLVYEHLRKQARRLMAAERPGRTLQATALVNEAFVRLAGAHCVEWQDRAHFYSLAARLMRRILVDLARKRGNQKRGGARHRTTLDEALLVSPGPDPDLVALDQALTVLAQMDPRKVQVVELKFFGGLDEREVARALDISVDTVQRDWKAAKAWLYGRLRCH